MRAKREEQRAKGYEGSETDALDESESRADAITITFRRIRSLFSEVQRGGKTHGLQQE